MADATIFELPGHIALALSLASASTGTDYGYLLKTAHRESSFQTDAKAATSSATGLFQFIEETWIRSVKDEGERFGLKDYADRITKTENGRYVIENPADRAAILALRKDARISALMAGAYAQRNTERIASEIGRKPTAGELYIAHFLGPTDAIKLILTRDSNPSFSAPDLFPRAAENNRTIFYALGRPLSVGQVYDRLVSSKSTASAGYTISGSEGVAPDFGSWKTQVARNYSVGAKAKITQLQGNAAGVSFLDWLAGTPSDDTAAGTGWSATLDADADAQAPAKVTGIAAAAPKNSSKVAAPATAYKPTPVQMQVADALPASATAKGLALIRGAVDETNARPGAQIVRLGASAPRLKIIHVPPRNP